MFCISKILYRIKLEDLSQSDNRERIPGRVQKWLRIPDRPSRKGILLILPFAADVRGWLRREEIFLGPSLSSVLAVKQSGCGAMAMCGDILKGALRAAEESGEYF